MQKGHDPDVSGGEVSKHQTIPRKRGKNIGKEENEFTLTNENSNIELCAS